MALILYIKVSVVVGVWKQFGKSFVKSKENNPDVRVRVQEHFIESESGFESWWIHLDSAFNKTKVEKNENEKPGTIFSDGLNVFTTCIYNLDI